MRPARDNSAQHSRTTTFMGSSVQCAVAQMPGDGLPLVLWSAREHGSLQLDICRLGVSHIQSGQLPPRGALLPAALSDWATAAGFSPASTVSVACFLYAEL